MIRNQFMPAIGGGVGMVFQAFDVGGQPNEVDDALLLFVAPGVVGRDVIRDGSDIVGVAHHLLQRVEGAAGDIRVEIAAENEREAVRVNLAHLPDDQLDALFLGLPGEAEMGVEVEEPLAGLVDLEQAPGEGPVILFVEGSGGDVRRLRDPEGAAVEQRENGTLIQETGSLAFVGAVVAADADAAVTAG